MNHIVNIDIYRAPDGTVTHDSNQGQNERVLVSGAVISGEEAKRLGIPALEEAARSTPVKDGHLSELKAFVPPAQVEATLPPTTEGTQQTTEGTQRLDSDPAHSEGTNT